MEALRPNSLGDLFEMPFTGRQTVDWFIKAFENAWPANNHDYGILNRPCPRVLHGVVGELDLNGRKNIYFPPMEAPAPVAGRPTPVQVECRTILTDGAMYRWMRDTMNQRSRLLRVIVHRQNRVLLPNTAPIPNTPVWRPAEEANDPSPMYLPEPRNEIFRRMTDSPLLPFKKQPIGRNPGGLDLDDSSGDNSDEGAE